MTEDERIEEIKKVLPDVVNGQVRPSDSIPTDFPFATSFPQLIANDPASFEVFNMVFRQIFSNFRELNQQIQDFVSQINAGWSYDENGDFSPNPNVMIFDDNCAWIKEEDGNISPNLESKWWIKDEDGNISPNFDTNMT
ncbi:hypothetical protein [Anaerovibrio sp. RM50]|uniref:hypothetical protein n=1 Tax=Anaerovibrio sp. RM50 TaxID=1200557 RepID=UPI00048215F4|nr:hypothetical protein [Anaerovibrio sp. RM50]